MTRPKRLWVVVLVNTAFGSLSLAGSLLFAKALHGAVLLAFVPNVLVCGVLITSSIFALLGHGRARWVALGIAILFFGIRLIQSLWLYNHPSQAQFTDMSSLASGAANNLLVIILNLWAFLSDKTEAFFDAAGPNNRVWTPPSSADR